MKKFSCLFLVIFIFMFAFTSQAQYRIDGQKPSFTNAELDVLAAKLHSTPTYGGEWRKVATSKRHATVHDGSLPSLPTPKVRPFDIQLDKLRLNDENLDQYLIPVTILPGKETGIGSVRVSVNDVQRAFIRPVEVFGEFKVERKITGFLMLFAEDAGTIRIMVVVEPFGGGTPQIEEFEYDVPTCRVPDIISFANPPHGTRYVKHVSQVHGLPTNLMLGGAFMVWNWRKEDFASFDPSLPQNLWPPTIKKVEAPTYYNNGYLTTEAYYWPGLEGYYMHVVPSVCGRFTKGEVTPFYTDKDDSRRKSSIDIEVGRSEPGRYLPVRATLKNAPGHGWMYGQANGYNKTIDWYHTPFDLPARVEESKDPQTRLFEFYTVQGFTYSIRVMYFGVNSRGYLELLADAETSRNIKGAWPCYFCPGQE